MVSSILSNLEGISLSILCFGLQRDNADHHTSIPNSTLRMQFDIAHEKKFMDALVESTQKVKVLKEQLKNAMIELAKVNEEYFWLKAIILK